MVPLSVMHSALFFHTQKVGVLIKPCELLKNLT